jgi:hypothetical protein
MVRISIVIVALASLAGCSLRVFRSEADEAAQRFIDKSFSKCGDSYLGSIPGRLWATYSQVKGLSVSTQPQDLSAADKLNGYEWIGQIRIECSSVRDFSQLRGWSQWYSGCGGMAIGVSAVYIPLYKRNGKWLFYGKWDDASYSPKIFSCGQIPPGP